MRIFRLSILLLTALALNNHALVAVTRASVVDQGNSMAAQTDEAIAQSNPDHDGRMDCCDPDSQKKPCDPAKDGACLCKVGNGCQSSQLDDSLPSLRVFAAETQLISGARLTPPLLARSPSRLLRPPIR